MRNLFRASVAVAVLGFAGAAQAEFLQPDPVLYKDQMNLYAYVHNDPLNRTDPTGRETFSFGLDGWLHAGAFDHNREGLIDIEVQETGAQHSADGVLGGGGIYISIPFGDNWRNERLDIGFYATGGLGNLDANGETDAQHRNDAGGGVGIDFTLTRGDGRTMSGAGSVTNYDAIIVGADVLRDSDGEALGVSAGPGVAAGVGEFQTRTVTYGAHDLFYDIKDALTNNDRQTLPD